MIFLEVLAFLVSSLNVYFCALMNIILVLFDSSLLFLCIYLWSVWEIGSCAWMLGLQQVSSVWKCYKMFRGWSLAQQRTSLMGSLWSLYICVCSSWVFAQVCTYVCVWIFVHVYHDASMELSWKNMEICFLHTPPWFWGLNACWQFGWVTNTFTHWNILPVCFEDL